MFHITSSLFGGLAAIAAWALVAPASNSPPQSFAGETATSVNRAAKSDRVIPPRLRGGDENTVSTVEVIGIRDAAIIYRDREGRVLFQTDPLKNVTVISRGFVLPQLTVRETPRSPAAPVEAPRQTHQTRPVIPVGCEPVASPIAQPTLAHLTGRCLS